jgi:protein tyrosine/serine phosphatase
MKKKSISPIVILAVIICISILTVRHFHIADFRVISDGKLYTSGQPKGMDYTRLLYKYHIATIVNVRASSEHREKNWYNEEVTWTKENAVNYIELPISRDDYFPDNQLQGKFLSIMSDPGNLPVLLHGYGDDKRVAMLTAVWLRRGENTPLDKILMQVKKILDDKPLTEKQISFITNLK